MAKPTPLPEHGGAKFHQLVELEIAISGVSNIGEHVPQGKAEALADFGSGFIECWSRDELQA